MALINQWGFAVKCGENLYLCYHQHLFFYSLQDIVCFQIGIVGQSTHARTSVFAEFDNKCNYWVGITEAKNLSLEIIFGREEQ